MIIQKNQNIKIILKNNIQVEGIVESCTDKEFILKSFDKKRIIIIPHPYEDIMVITILLDYAPIEKLEKNKINIEEQIQKVVEQPSADDLRLKKIIELKKELIKQDKAIIAEKLKDHTASSGLNLTQYSYPRKF